MKNVNCKEGVNTPSAHRFFMVVDTETTGSLSNLLIYDFSYIIYDRLQRKILIKSANLVQEVFTNQELMSGAYYYKKMGLYREYLKNGLYIQKPYNLVLREFREHIKEFDIVEVWAHNASFDKNALKSTHKKLGRYPMFYPLPFGTYWYCSLKLAKETLSDNKEYQEFCEKYGFLTKRNKPQLTAETVYRFLRNKPDFIEEHTGIKDALIELEIIKSIGEETKPTLLKSFFKGGDPL